MDLRGSRHSLLALALVCLVGAFYLATLREGHIWGDDHCGYISHARNIVEGRPYGETGFVWHTGHVAAKMFPPLFPLILAPLYHQFGLALTPMKVACILFFCVALFCFYRLVREEAGEGPALVALAITGFCPYFWDFKETIYSEYPFLAFAFGTLWLARTAGRLEAAGARWAGLGALVGLLGGVAYGIRNAGLVVIAAILLHHLFVYRRVTAFAVGTAVAFVVAVLAQKVLFRVEADYLGALRAYLTPHRLAASPFYYARCLSVLWENGYSVAAQYALYGVTAVLAAYGFLRRVRGGVSVLEFFVALYLPFIFVFVWGGRRYLMPVMPLFVWYAVLGLVGVTQRAASGVRRAAWGGLAVGVALSFVGRYTTLPWREIAGGLRQPEVVELIRHVRDTVGPHGLVAFEKPRFLALYAGTRAMYVDESGTVEQALQHLREVGATHLITSDMFHDLTEAFTTRLVREWPDQFAEQFRNACFAVYRVK